MNPLLDKNFLKDLDNSNLKTVYAKIYALNQQEEIVEAIEGRITQGNINIDGKSAVRRTCNLTIVANELNIHQYYWGLHTKFKLFIGVENNINIKYPEIIWFPQGTYVISNFNTAQGLGNYTISIQGKDKMTQLNGELGGTITALTHNFGEYEYIDENGIRTIKKNIIRDIITDAVHELGGEPLYNIIINDLENTGLELMEYRGQDPLYVFINKETQEPEMITLDGNTKVFIAPGVEVNISDGDSISYDPLFSLDDKISGNITVVFIEVEGGKRKNYTIAKLERPMTAGYRATDLTYAGDLILNAGETITSLLDKIVTMLGEFEYFYDLEGRFIFQRKKTYINTTWNNIVQYEGEEYVDNVAHTSAISYSFENSLLAISFNNTPDYVNLKNDYSIWGKRKSVSGQEIPIHIRYSINERPFLYTSIADNGKVYTTMNEQELNKYLEFNQPTKEVVYNQDWRELIYQMAIDYRKYNRREDFYITLQNLNPHMCVNGNTGYEIYYTDMEGFWRQLYNPEYEGSYQMVSITKAEYENEEPPGGKDKPQEYYYDVLKYTQCNPSMKFHKLMEYYTYVDDYIIEGTQVLKNITLTEEEYLKNPELYYYINIEDMYEKHPCIIVKKYRDLDPNYFNQKGEKIYTNVSKEEYDNSVAPGGDNKYYFLYGENFKPCGRVEKYAEYYKYKMLSNDSLANPTEEIYYRQPGLYYYTTEIYEQLQEDAVYNSSETYYVAEKEYKTDNVIYVKVNISQSYFEHDPSRFYVKTGEIINTKCVEDILGGFKPYEYYTLEGKEYKPVEINSEESYKEYLAYGNLYYKEKIYKPCRYKMEYDSTKYYYIKIEDEYREGSFWNENVYRNPEGLNFWIDFVEDDSELQKYSCKNIGVRQKSENNDKIRAIYFKECPTIIFFKAEEEKNLVLGYTYIQIQDYMEPLFSISGQGQSAKNVLDEYLYKYSCCAESINITSIPIYYLEPNTRIFIRDDKSGLNNEYIINSISYQLGPSGNMTINAIKAIERLF